MCFDTLSNNNKHNYITNITLSEHINSLRTDIAKWQKKRIQRNATQRAAIAAKNYTIYKITINSFHFLFWDDKEIRDGKTT